MPPKLNAASFLVVHSAQSYGETCPIAGLSGVMFVFFSEGHGGHTGLFCRAGQRSGVFYSSSDPVVGAAAPCEVMTLAGSTLVSIALGRIVT